jgi:DNA (cytosine-5)-methyltransferase 1
MTARLGSLCTGYGGLEQGLAQLFDFDLAWVSDIDKGANKILAHRHPDVPNLGDFTELEWPWREVEPVDILTAGFPCQPVSHAGKRAGTDDERWLFDDITRLVGLLDPRPRLLVFENVLGLLSANRGHAMARVVHGLAQIGYVGRWRTLRASDVGAPHRRERVFIVAEPAEHTDRIRLGPNQRGSSGDLMLPSAVMELLPTPRATRGGRHTETTALLPTPTTQPTTGNGHARNLGAEARLLPTPTAQDSAASGGGYNGQTNVTLTDATARQPERWGDYAPAIARWEQTIGRPAPAPTETGPKGSPRLSPRFVEWMMGLPEGWVTDVPDLTRNEQLKALGNGVVPQQAAAAVGWLLDAKAAAA